ncbi:hypothetical protein SAMN05216350_10273 [Polaromonas sp. YR568]|uniref:hypothetical protein n=1 Tax=Polaromonas sp. YR568 TaxID=1855301 RepID=UPI0008E8AAFF|nr:hypothetical protein [Polaromonas sp. YR568]SFU47746.1 hypothetical protein SAMN05216350_10273 [Polaromonas sp. YR568]
MNRTFFTNLALLNWGLCIWQLMMYREDPYPLTLHIALGLTVVLNITQLAFSIFRSTRDAYLKTSMEVVWMMVAGTLLGAIAIYLDADFVNRGTHYNADTFYVLVQASLVQGLASLVCMAVRWVVPPR